MKQRSITLNAALNLTRTVLSTIFPLITARHISLVLGVENVGKFNYSASIISYFSLIAIFGISTYAVREGARLRDHRDSIQKFSNQVLTINCITTLIAYLLLVLLLWFSHGLRSYVGIILLQSASILFTTIGIEWVNTVFEDYLYTTVRWLVLQVLSIVLMLVFVREQEHLYRYVLISLLPVVGANISNLFYCRRYVKFRLTRNLELKKHLPPLFVLFIANITNIIFVNSGQTMLGAICGNFSSGIYGTAAKVYTMIKVVFTSVLVVFMPRISNLFVKTDAKQMKKVVTDIFNMFLLLLMPLATGLFVMSSFIIDVIAGPEFAAAVPVLKILAIAIIPSGLSTFITYISVVPAGRDKLLLGAGAVASGANLTVNSFMIPLFQHNGAAVSSIVAEIAMFMTAAIRMKPFENYRKIAVNVLQCVVSCALIPVAAFLSGLITDHSFLWAFLTVLISVIFYFTALFLMKNVALMALLTPISEKLKARKKS